MNEDKLTTSWYESRLLNGKGHAKWTYWDEDGQKRAEAEWKDGEPHGKWTEWYENGQLTSIKTFHEGNLVSEWIEKVGEI